MQAVVLAGGRATRLAERTQDVPKYLVEVAGRPFAHWQLERLRASGIERVVLCIGHLGHQIEQALGDGGELGVMLRYSHDGDELLGTAGALRAAAHLLEPTFVVTYGDSWLPFDYGALLRDLDANAAANGTMAVFENTDRWDRSNVRLEGQRVLEYDKRGGERFQHIDYGATALRRPIVEALGPGRADLATVQRSLAEAGTLRAFVVSERFYEIGSPSGLDELDHRLRADPTSLLP